MAHGPKNPAAETGTPFDARRVLREHGLRVTRQREDLYNALAATKAHPSADELFNSVRHNSSGLSLATVYNTLEVFVDAGLCRKIHAAGATRYDATTSNHAHVQTTDGRVLDLPSDLSERIQRAIDPEMLRRIEAELGVSIASISFGVGDHAPANPA
jgi:Fur family peroxide stress response transcriptional regulator